MVALHPEVIIVNQYYQTWVSSISQVYNKLCRECMKTLMEKYSNDLNSEMHECKTDGYRIQHKKSLIGMDTRKQYKCDICKNDLYILY